MESSDSEGPSAILARESHQVTVAGLTVARKTLVMTVVGLLIAVVGVIVAVVAANGQGQGSDNSVDVGGTGNAPNHCGVVGAGASCTISGEKSLEEAVRGSSSDTEVKQHLRQDPNATRSPEAPGPWPFAVVDTGQLGLFARTSPEANGTRVGNAGNLTLVWADCQAVSTFTPADVTGENNVGPTWLRVRWKHLGDGIQRGLSEPTQTQTAFMYRGALEPVGNNGQLPTC